MSYVYAFFLKQHSKRIYPGINSLAKVRFRLKDFLGYMFIDSSSVSVVIKPRPAFP